MKKTILLMIFAGASIFSTTAMAGTSYLRDTPISFYAMSADQPVHFIQVDNRMLNNDSPHPTCGRNAYLLATDTQLFSTALAVALSGKKVSVVYTDGQPSKSVIGHTMTCRVIGIWWPAE